jgi:hypothetical protein
MIEVIIGKLDKEISEKGLHPEHGEPIRAYLINRCEEDPVFSSRVQMPEKTLKHCIHYVIETAKAKLSGKSGYLSDSAVFEMVDEYYTGDGLQVDTVKQEPEESEAPAAKPTPQKTSSYSDYKAKKAEKPAPKEKPVKKAPDQVSFFDFMG